MEAVRRGDIARVRGIMSSGLGLDSAPHPLPPMTPPLIEAVCAGHRDMVEMFLDRKANLNARDVALGVSRRQHVIAGISMLLLFSLARKSAKGTRDGGICRVSYVRSDLMSTDWRNHSQVAQRCIGRLHPATRI